MKKFLLLCLVCCLLLCGCGKVPKLQNGEEAMISFSKGDKKYQISVDEVYSELKNNYGLQVIVDLIDKYVLEEEFADKKEEAKIETENFVNSMITQLGGEETFLELLRQQTGLQTIEAYTNAMYISSLKTYARDTYAKSLVTDKEIDDYYKNEAKGDVEVYHILVTADVKDDMTTTEKKEAEDAAKAKIQEIIKKLNDASNKLEEFKKLVKEYSEDEATKDKDGNLGFINIDFGENYDELIKAAYKLKDGEYSKSIITTEVGYHVIYRNASKEKESKEDLKDEIVEILAKRKTDADEKMETKALKYYRELYNMNINDDEIDRQYGIYMHNLLNQTAKNEEE